jgi:hypothetical protein
VRWIALAVALLAALLIVTLLVRRESDRPTARLVSDQTTLTHDNSERSQALANPAARNTAEPRSTPAVTDDLCGINGSGRIRAARETVEQHVARLTHPAISHWQSAVAGSDDLRLQAIGLALANAQPVSTLNVQPSKDTPVNNSLVLLAMESHDPAVYALALGQCWDADVLRADNWRA